MPRLVIAGLLLALSASKSFAATARKPAPIGYALQPVPIHEVTLANGFWSKRIHTHTHVTIPHVLKTLNIDYANPQPDRSALALVRTLEGAAYCLMMENDPKLRGMMEKISKNIGGLYRGGNRWFGGCPEAAAYLSLVTGKENEWLKEVFNEYRQRDGEYFQNAKSDIAHHGFDFRAAGGQHQCAQDLFEALDRGRGDQHLGLADGQPHFARGFAG